MEGDKEERATNKRQKREGTEVRPLQKPNRDVFPTGPLEQTGRAAREIGA